MILKKKPQKTNVNAAYRTETESEQEELYLYTVKENNIDCVDRLNGDKHKIKMKVDTGDNGNIIPLRIYKKNIPTRRQQRNGKTDRHKKGVNYPMGSKRYKNTSKRVNDTEN